MSGRKIMSLEAAMEEERAEIENLILQQQAGIRSPPPSASLRSPSPFGRTPQSPVRSMLDVVDTPKSPPPPRVRSMLDLDSPPPPPLQRPKSMLDIGGDPVPPSPRSPGVTSTHTSPTLSYKAPVEPNFSRMRSGSDASSKTADFSVRSSQAPQALNSGSMSSYRFGNILPTNVGQAQPGRRVQNQSARSSSIGEALRGPDLSNLVLPGDRNRSFPNKRGSNKSKSPSGRFSLRSSSPHGSLLGGNSGKAPSQSSGMLTLASGEVVDMSTAYRRLSDANLIYGGSSLAKLVTKKQDADSTGRIEKDNLSPYGELLSDEDTDEYEGNSSDEETQRGRKLTTRADTHESKTPVAERAKSLLAAVEDERKHVSQQPQYRSLFDEPAITVTGPDSEKLRQAKMTKPAVQPETGFDQEPMSGSNTPLDPERDADVSAIKLAQRLQLSSTPIISQAEVQRSIRILYRGDYTTLQREAADEHRRLRKYLVATDLSDESTHALEWAIGTVLRDGDTLIAIYCMDEEASGLPDVGSQVQDDPKTLREQAAAVNAAARSAKTSSLTGSPHPFGMGRGSGSPHLRAVETKSADPSPAPSSRGKSSLELERERIVQDITERVSKLLRKTHLQVRVIVEVIHCKNPKHLITEVIDLVNPTLVVLGSRGRSALKGTLLGSFSNYLVTKSSVPVMVARKRLRKKNKYQPPPNRQVNNLANPSARTLESARID